MLVNLIVKDSKILGIITSPISDRLPKVEIESLDDINVGYDTYENGKIVSQEVPVQVKNKERILALKKLLVESDYQCLKHADGELTDEEYESIKAQRHAWRAEINELEN